MRALTLAAVLALAGCAGVQPVSRAAADAGMRVYVVGELSFEAPSDWRATGDGSRVRLVAPGEDATIEASAARRDGPGPACLEDAEAALSRGAAGLGAVQRHGSTFAGQKAVAQEADQGPWHGWAWATCSGGIQYRVWFAGRSPLSRPLIEVQKRLVASARLGGSP